MSILLQTLAMIINPPRLPNLLPTTPSRGGAVIRRPGHDLSVTYLLAICLARQLHEVEPPCAPPPRTAVAALMGIRPRRRHLGHLHRGAVLAAVAGVMYASNWHRPTRDGLIPGLRPPAAVFGGIGNLAGAVVGGILLGLIEAIGSGYIGALTGDVLGSHYSDIFAFIVLIIMLTLRPSGLLGERVADRA
jgi:branched-chain amino acid transport system permease protein